MKKQGTPKKKKTSSSPKRPAARKSASSAAQKQAAVQTTGPKKENKKRKIFLIAMLATVLAAAAFSVYYYTQPERRHGPGYEQARRRWIASGRTYGDCIVYSRDKSRSATAGTVTSVWRNRCGFPVKVYNERVRGIPLNAHTNLNAPIHTGAGVVIRPGRSFYERWHIYKRKLPFFIPSSTFSAKAHITH